MKQRLTVIGNTIRRRQLAGVVHGFLDPSIVMSSFDTLSFLAGLAAVSLLTAPECPAQAPSATATAPRPDVTITMRDYAFEVDSTLPSGQHVISLRNEGHRKHLMLLTRLSSEKTSRDVVSSLEHKSDAAAGEVVVASAEVKPGTSTVVTVDLTPGRYSLCARCVGCGIDRTTRAEWSATSSCRRSRTR